MATAPKTIVKSVAKGGASAAPAAEGGATKKSGKKMMIMIVVGVLVLVLGAGGAFMVLGKKKGGKDAAKEEASAKVALGAPPVFFPLEPFTVNLMSETGDQFLQATFTLQVPDQAAVELLKLYTPQIRSRLLILLSGKRAAEIASTEGKQKLAEEIIALTSQPFQEGGPEQKVNGVFITSFVIQ